MLVPWRSPGGYREARGWAAEIGKRVVAALPEQATMERSKANRGGRVYLDIMQNVKGRHVVPPYVLRPVPEAMVSTPLDWREVTNKLNPQAFNIKTIRKRLAKQKRDPMAGLAAAWT